MPDAFTIALAALIAFWLFSTVLVIACCQTAARADAELAPRTRDGEDTYKPRRASTCGTVRSKILKSPQSDQFATYK